MAMVTMTCMSKKDREMIHLALPVGAKSLLNEAADRRDMKLIGVAARLITWFVAQDYTLQNIILGLMDEEDTVGVIELIKERQAKEKAQRVVKSAKEKAARRRSAGHKPAQSSPAKH